jgi:hypothetical protein
VKGGGDAALTLPAQPRSKDVTLRLQIEEREGAELLPRLDPGDRGANPVPWDGSQLNTLQNVKLCCGGCRNVLLEEGAIVEWRDLPNEDWAEMMDFWHCHKPEVPYTHGHSHQEEDVVQKKGYAAANRLTASGGIGFVDLSFFLFARGDLRDVMVSLLGFYSSPRWRFVTILHVHSCCLPGRKKAINLFNGAVVDTTALH